MKTKFNYKRIAAWMMVVVLLAGCGPKPTPPMPTATSAAAPLPTTAATPAFSIPDLSAADIQPAAPQVIDYLPAQGNEPGTDTRVELLFDQAMDPQSVEAAFSLADEAGEAVEGSFSWEGRERLVFKPARALQPSAYYRVALQSEAKADAGVTLADAFTFRFKTITSLAVSQVFPAGGETDVTVDSPITVLFNRPVAALGISEDQVDLPQPLSFEPPVPGMGKWVSTSLYVFQPEAPLKSDNTYTVKVAAGLKDAGGEAALAMVKDYRWRFTTLRPTLYSLQVDQQEYNINDLLDGINIGLTPKIKIGFTQAMERVSTQRALSITDDSKQPLPFSVEWNADNRMMTVSPLRVLNLDSGYTLRLGTDALAADGGALERILIWRFRTVPAPGIVSTYPPDGAKDEATYNFTIQFSSPMRVSTIPERVKVTPALEGGRVDWYYDESSFSANFYGLKTSTQYSVQILPGMQDLYGNRISTGMAVNFSTAAATPSAYLNMLNQPLYRSAAPQIFYASYTNVATLNFKIYSVDPGDLAGSIPVEDRNYGGIQGVGSLDNVAPVGYRPNNSATLVADFVYQTKGNPDTGSLDKVEIVTLDGKPLPPGAYFLAMDSEEISHESKYLDSRYFVVTDIFLAFKNGPTDALIWATDAQSGDPLAGMELELFNVDEKDQRVKMGSGKTDRDGLLHLTFSVTNGARYVTSASGTDFTFAQNRWDVDVSLDSFGISNVYSYDEFDTLAYIYTDRPLYRPGQPVYFKGILRTDDDLTYLLPDLKEVEVAIYDYDKEVYRQVLPLSASGAFDAEFMLDQEAALGSYTITAEEPGGGGKNYGSVNFNVAEYRKPEFQIDLTADPANLLLGASITARVKATYYSGGVLNQATVDWALRARPFLYNPPEAYSAYSFSSAAQDDDWRAYRYEYEGENLIAEGRVITGEDGEALFKVPVETATSSASQQLTLETTITDFAGNPVSSRVDVVAHRAEVYAGIRPAQYVGKAGEEQAFNVVALDWDGNPLAGQVVSVAVSERQWFSVQKEDAQGVLRWETNVKDIPVAAFNQPVDEKGLTVVRFMPQKGGIYQAVVTVKDGQGRANQAAAYLWVAGTDYIPWRQSSDRTFQLVTDRTSYEPGMSAEILIASPFQGDAYALVTVERGKIRQKEVLHLTNNSTIYRLPISEDMGPAVYVSVTVVKGIDETNPIPAYKTGITRINVSTDRKILQVGLKPDRTQAAPGEKVTYAIRTLDSSGKPVSAELSLGLSDLASLALSDPNSAPIDSFFYGLRGLVIQTILSHSMNVDEYNAMLNEMVEGKGMGAGDKGSPYLGVVGVRQKFDDTAYWKAVVQTDENGVAEVTVTLPDNLTTWRMDARAVTNDTLVGQTTIDIVSNKLLMLRPQTPRFFVAGDQARVSAAIHNDTGKKLTVSASLDAQGVVLQGKAEQEVVIQAGQQALVSWKVSVPAGSVRADLLFSAKGGDYQDSSLPPLGTLEGQGIPVYRYEAPETVGTSGELGAAETRSEVIHLPSRYEVTSGNLRVQIEPSLAAGMESGLDYLDTYPYESVDVSISRILPAAALLRALNASGVEDKPLLEKLDLQVSTTLQRLYSQQNSDGGWGWWSGMDSDPVTSAYVMLGLAEALESGYPVDETALENGKIYLDSQLGDLESGQNLTPTAQRSRQAFMLYVFARFGGFSYYGLTEQIYAERLTLSLYAKAFLAQTLYMLNDQDERVTTLISELVSAAALSASGASWEEENPDPWNWNTDTRTTAIVLEALVQIDPQNAVTANGIRWLMHNRRNGCWWNTYETAWALTTLANWLEASGELKANYAYALALNGKTLHEGQVNSQNLRDTQSLSVDIADLLADQANRLVFGRSDGEGRMYYTTFLTVNLPVDQIQPLDQGFSLSRRYFRSSNLKTPITTAASGEILDAELTIVVPNSLHYVMITDPLPAGLEAVDGSLKTSPQGSPYDKFDWSLFDSEGWGWWYFQHVELRDEKVALFANWLPSGTYVYRYRVRAVTPGTYQVIPPTGQEVYFPDVYGRGAGSVFVVK